MARDWKKLPPLSPCATKERGGLGGRAGVTGYTADLLLSVLVLGEREIAWQVPFFYSISSSRLFHHSTLYTLHSRAHHHSHHHYYRHYHHHITITSIADIPVCSPRFLGSGVTGTWFASVLDSFLTVCCWLYAQRSPYVSTLVYMCVMGG